MAASADWRAAQTGGRYRAASLEAEGFIHCCTEEQLAGVLERYFEGRSDLVLLRLDPSHVGGAWRWEGGFPHLYAELPVDAVISAQSLSI